jgi:hypothetical protein
MAAGWRIKEERKRFFFEKKKQKTFLNWAEGLKVPAVRSTVGIAPEGVLVLLPPTQRNKKFLRRFFQKAALSF